MSSLDTAQSASLREAAARATNLGELIDAAVLQTLREQLWSAINENAPPEDFKDLLSMVLSARRQTVAEEALRLRQGHKEISEADLRKEIEEITTELRSNNP